MPGEQELEEAERETDEAIARAKEAAAEEDFSRGAVREDFGGEPPEHVPEEIDQPPLQ